MSFEAFETSRALGSPVGLFYFRYGTEAASFYAYTDADHEITAPGSLGGVDVVYVPKSIERGNIVMQGTLDRTSLELRMPRNVELAELFRVYPPSQVVTAVIRAGHLGEASGDYPAVWSGRVIGFAFEGSEAVFALEPLITSLRRTGLRRHWQFGCPHILYGPDCQADKEAATKQVNITSASGTTIVMPADWFAPLTVDKYVGGQVQWVNAAGDVENRTIIRTVGSDDLVVDGIVSIPDGTEIDVILGCNHRHGMNDLIGDCKNLHDNLLNFGGQPWIPLKNPFHNNSSIFY